MLRIIARVLFTTTILLCLSGAYSQDLIYKGYNRQDGLPSPTIHSIFQDRDGFLWIGTESGLCRYDGSRFKTFTVKDGLQGNEVFGMMQDRIGRIWIKQYKNTIAYIYKGKIWNQHNDSTLRKLKFASRVYGMAEDSEGNICLADRQTVFIISKAGDIRTIDRVDGRPLWIVGVDTDREKRFIFCINGDLYRLDNDGLNYVQKISGGADMSENSVLLHRNYIPYSKIDSIVTVYLKDTTLLYKIGAGFPIKYSAISDSVFSINTIDGAFLINIGTHDIVHLLPGFKVSNVLKDSENNLWLGTMHSGIYKLSSDAIHNQTIGDANSEVSYLSKTAGGIIVGNNNAQAYEYANNRFTLKTNVISRAAIGKVHYYEEIGNKRFVVVDAHDILSYNGFFPDHFAYLVAIKHAMSYDRDRLLTSVNSGLYLVSKHDLCVTDTIWRRRSLCALRINDSLLVGTPAGLFILKQHKGQVYLPAAVDPTLRSGTNARMSRPRWQVVDSLLNSSILHGIQQSADKLIWVSTYEDGLYCVANGKLIHHFTEKDGLPSNNCRSLFIKGNVIWLGTDRGLVKITPKNNRFLFQEYSTSEGLPSDNINSVYVDSSLVYIGTPDGLCYFDETKIETRSMCNLVITGIRIGDSTAEFRDSYSLYRKQRFIVEFSGISMRSEKAMTYRYRINGIDDDWRTTTVNSLEFTSLPYGSYELEIVAINKFGKESAPVKVGFTIVRPFHKSIWFIVLLAVLGVLLILYLYNRWLNARKQKQLQQLRQEIKLMELEQMALRAQMNPHFIFNCINAMQQLVLENDADNASRFISSFSNLVRQTLENASELLIPLKEEVKFLTSYFELERIRMEDSFSYVIDTSGINTVAAYHVPNMVIQPFVENAIKHGVLNRKDHKGFIEVKFTQDDGRLRCMITDNGIGREKAAQMRKQTDGDHVSKGMSITFKRVESLNTLLHDRISIMVHDLKDEQGHAMGTRVTIDFQKQ